MASLTSTALPALGIVKILVDWLPYKDDLVTLYRMLPDGSQWEVTGSPVRLSGGKAVVYDTTPPLDVDLSYRAVMPQPVTLRDSFTRTVASSWGTPEFSTFAGAWGMNGASSQFSVDSNADAAHTHTAAGQTYHSNAPGTYTDVRIEGTMWIPVKPLTASMRVGINTRYVDGNNTYSFQIIHQTNDKTTLQIIRREAAVDTILAQVDTALLPAPNRRFRMEVESVGRKHRMTVWTYTGRSNAHTLEVEDSTFTSGGVGFRSRVISGNTNTMPVGLRFDDAYIQSLVPLTLATTETETVIAAPHGWIRDPLDPGRSIRLDNCDSHTFDCLGGNQMVFFRGFGGEDYKSSTGVFAVNNSIRPVTVSQVRKDFTSVLRFASVTLADITRVRRLFATGRNLVLSLPEEYGWGIDRYGTDSFTAGDLSAERLNPRDARKPYRDWSAEMVVVNEEDDLPDGRVGGNAIPIPGATYGDMTASGLTYAQLQDSDVLFPQISDTFTARTEVDGWGSAETSEPYAVRSGTQSAFFVNSGTAGITLAVRNQAYRITVDGANPDSAGQVDITVPVAPVGGSIAIFGVARYENANNFLLCGGFIETSGSVTATMISRSGGVDSFLGGLVNAGGAHVAGDTYTAKWSTLNNTAQSKIWKTGTAEPGWINSGVVPAVGAGALVTDTFGRTAASTWGTTTSGQVWTNGGGSNSDYSVNGSVGQILLNTLNVSRRLTLPTTYTDIDQVVEFTISQVGVGDDIETTLMTRYQDSTNYMQGSVYWDGDSTFAEARIVRRVAGTATTLAVVTLPFTQTGAGLSAWGRLRSVGTSYQFKVWDGALSDEPVTWSVEATDSTWTSGRAGIRANLQPGFTGTLPVTVSVDNYAIYDPNLVTTTVSVGAHALLDTNNTNTLPVTLRFDNLMINHFGRTYLDWAQGVHV